MAKENNIKNESVDGKTQNNKSFKYSDALENCDEAIEKYMSEPNGVVSIRLMPYCVPR